jgi:hypothetical protein
MTPLAASISDATIWSVTFDDTRSITFDDTRSVNYDRNSFIIQATGLTHKHYTKLERTTEDQLSSLLLTFMNHGRKKLIT